MSLNISTTRIKVEEELRRVQDEKDEEKRRHLLRLGEGTDAVFVTNTELDESAATVGAALPSSSPLPSSATSKVTVEMEKVGGISPAPVSKESVASKESADASRGHADAKANAPKFGSPQSQTRFAGGQNKFAPHLTNTMPHLTNTNKFTPNLRIHLPGAQTAIVSTTTTTKPKRPVSPMTLKTHDEYLKGEGVVLSSDARGEIYYTPTNSEVASLRSEEEKEAVLTVKPFVLEVG